MITEKDIVHENGNYWVLDNRSKRWTYDVMQNIGMGSITRQSFSHDQDGRSLAVAYCNYLAKNNSK